MPVYVYDDLKDETKSAVYTSMVQLCDVTGFSYRKLQRIFEECDIYCDWAGKYRIVKTEIVKDGRKNNRFGNV